MIHREKRLLEKVQQLEQLIQENKDKLRLELMAQSNMGLQLKSTFSCYDGLLHLYDSDNQETAELKAECVHLKDIVKDDDETIEEELQAMVSESRTLTANLKKLERFDESMILLKESLVMRLRALIAEEEQRVAEDENTTIHVLQSETQPVRRTSSLRSLWKRFTKLFKT